MRLKKMHMAARALVIISAVIVLPVIFAQSASASSKKVLFVNSYHQGYHWSDMVESGALEVFNGLNKEAENGFKGEIEIRFFRMDTKRNPSSRYAQKQALKAKRIIRSWKPDVIIASDDNASKYLIAPYYLNSTVSVVFCGVNADISEYGYPAQNITGIRETSFVAPLLKALSGVTKTGLAGFLDASNTTSRKLAAQYRDTYSMNLKEVYVENFSAWKDAFIKLQDGVDFLIVSNNGGIKGWDNREAEEFVLKNTSVLTVSLTDLMAPYSVLVYSASGKEHGRWAARKALEIIKGKNPSDIPVAVNTEERVFLNMPLYEKLGIGLPQDVLKQAVDVK